MGHSKMQKRMQENLKVFSKNPNIFKIQLIHFNFIARNCWVPCASETEQVFQVLVDFVFSLVWKILSNICSQISAKCLLLHQKWKM